MTTEYLYNLLKENNISFASIENENIRSLMESVEEIANGRTPIVHIPNLPKFPIPQNTSNYTSTISDHPHEPVLIQHKKCPFKVIKEERKHTNSHNSE